jgi:hypothetical protein
MTLTDLEETTKVRIKAYKTLQGKSFEVDGETFVIMGIHVQNDFPKYGQYRLYVSFVPQNNPNLHPMHEMNLDTLLKWSGLSIEEES